MNRTIAALTALLALSACQAGPTIPEVGREDAFAWVRLTFET